MSPHFIQLSLIYISPSVSILFSLLDQRRRRGDVLLLPRRRPPLLLRRERLLSLRLGLLLLLPPRGEDLLLGEDRLLGERLLLPPLLFLERLLDRLFLAAGLALREALLLGLPLSELGLLALVGGAGDPLSDLSFEGDFFSGFFSSSEDWASRSD